MHMCIFQRMSGFAHKIKVQIQKGAFSMVIK